MGWHRFSFIEIAEKFNKASKAGVSGADSYGMLLILIRKRKGGGLRSDGNPWPCVLRSTRDCKTSNAEQRHGKPSHHI